MLQVTARNITGFLLLFLLVTQSLSTAFLLQGRDSYAAGKCNLVVSDRKATQITSDHYKNIRRTMVADDDMKKEIGIRGAKNARKSRMLKSRESYRARFVAFNADYKGPKHHPPKNN